MEDHQNKNNNFRWIRFTGDSVARWSEIIDDVPLKQIPVELIDAVKFTTHTGDEISVKISDLVDPKSENIGDAIDNAIESRRNELRSVEFSINFDKLEHHIVDAIIKLFDNSET